MVIAFIGSTIFSGASFFWEFYTRSLSLNNYLESLSFVYAKIKGDVSPQLSYMFKMLNMLGFLTLLTTPSVSTTLKEIYGKISPIPIKDLEDFEGN